MINVKKGPLFLPLFPFPQLQAKPTSSTADSLTILGAPLTKQFQSSQTVWFPKVRTDPKGVFTLNESKSESDIFLRKFNVLFVSSSESNERNFPPSPSINVT